MLRLSRGDARAQKCGHSGVARQQGRPGARCGKAYRQQCAFAVTKTYRRCVLGHAARERALMSASAPPVSNLLPA